MGGLGARFGLSRYEADEYYRIALVAYRANNLEEALLNMGYAIALEPYVAEYFAARGLMFLEDSVLDRAQADFENALTMHSFEMLSNYGMGVINYRNKQYEVALEYFMRAWAVDQQRPETLYYLAMSQHRLRNNQDAFGWMQQAHARFEALGDKAHSRDSEKWLREFSRLAQQKP